MHLLCHLQTARTFSVLRKIHNVLSRFLCRKITSMASLTAPISLKIANLRARFLFTQRVNESNYLLNPQEVSYMRVYKMPLVAGLQ